jgi:hypothetical protein
MKTQNKTTMANKTTKATKVATAQVTKVTAAPVKTTKVVSEKSTKVEKEKTTKVVSQSFLVPTEDKKSYLEKKKAMINGFKDEIGGLTAMIKFALTDKRGIDYTKCFVDFNKNHWQNQDNLRDYKVGLENLFSIMPEEIRYITQKFNDEIIVCYDKDGNPIKRNRFTISAFEKCFKLFYENLAKKNEVAKANVKQTKKGAKAPVKNQISKVKKSK